MTADVVQMPARPTAPLLTKKLLAQAIGRSVRWVEQKQHEGLPVHSTDRSGRNRYRLADVEAWIAGGRVPGVEDRVAVLEREVQELRALVERSSQTKGEPDA